MFTITMLISISLVLAFSDVEGLRSFVATFKGEV